MVSTIPQDASVFGFRLQCEEPLHFLRLGGGVEPLEVVTAREARRRPETEPLADWVLGGAGQEARATLYRVDRGFEFWATDAGAFHIDPERGRIEIPEGVDAIVREHRLWGIPSMLCYQHRGDFSLHAAAVEVGGGAVVFGAPSRYGKTTLALAFHQRGYRVLSEDLSCCRVGALPEIIPGPAVLRVRPDVFQGRAPSGTHVVKARADRVFLAFDDDRKGSSRPVPISAIVFLRESPDGPRLERAAPAVALADLWALNFRLPTSEARARSFEQLTGLASRVPIWNLYRPLRMDQLDDTVDLFEERLLA